MNYDFRFLIQNFQFWFPSYNFNLWFFWIMITTFDSEANFGLGILIYEINFFQNQMWLKIIQKLINTFLIFKKFLKTIFSLIHKKNQVGQKSEKINFIRKLWKISELVLGKNVLKKLIRVDFWENSIKSISIKSRQQVSLDWKSLEIGKKLFGFDNARNWCELKINKKGFRWKLIKWQF